MYSNIFIVQITKCKSPRNSWGTWPVKSLLSLSSLFLVPCPNSLPYSQSALCTLRFPPASAPPPSPFLFLYLTYSFIMSGNVLKDHLFPSPLYYAFSNRSICSPLLSFSIVHHVQLSTLVQLCNISHLPIPLALGRNVSFQCSDFVCPIICFRPLYRLGCSSLYLLSLAATPSDVLETA